ncbi:unnamed protein product [Ixodes pacificus]
MSDMASTSKKRKAIDMGTKCAIHQELSAGEQHKVVCKSIVGEVASVDVERAEQ